MASGVACHWEFWLHGTQKAHKERKRWWKDRLVGGELVRRNIKKWWQHRSQKSGATASLWPTLSASQFLGSSLLRYPPPLSWRPPVLYPAKTAPLHTMPWAFIHPLPRATQTSGLMPFYSKTLRQIELWEHEQRGRSRWCRGRATQKEEKEQAVVAGHKGNNAMP